MEIRVNGNATQAQGNATLADVLARFDVTPETAGVAVAVNETVVPKRDWRERSLGEGDTVEIIHAVQGG